MLESSNSGLEPELSRHGYRFVKRVFDLSLSSVAITVGLIPSLVLCAVIYAKSPGASPIYSQYRVGRLKKDGSYKVFKMYKFRSMRPGADAMLESLRDANEADGPLFKIKDDPRVIPGVGTFIRKHSIDELGQMLNVWLGDMSFIGPRPPFAREVLEYDEYHRRRLTVKPGCGGLWQTTVRSDGSFNEMVKLDHVYIEKSCAAYDLSLIAETVKVVVTGKGAY